VGVIDIDDIRDRYQQTQAFLDERGRRLFAANEALAQGLGGVTAVAVATGVARSTINRGIKELRSGQIRLAAGSAVAAAAARVPLRTSPDCRLHWRR